MSRIDLPEQTSDPEHKHERQLTQAAQIASEPVLRTIWENAADSAYDEL